MRAPVLLLAMSAALAGCDLAPHYHVPLTKVPVSFTEAAAWQVAAPADHIPRGAWWQMFGDPTLDRLEPMVESGNANLAAALASFQQARALAAEADAGLYPTLSLGGHITTNRQSNHRPLRGAGQPNQYLDNAIDAQASYEVDLWDRVANAIKTGRAAAQASAADLEEARLSLHAELANDYVTLRGLDAQARVLADAAHTYARALDVTQARFAGKIASGIDVSRAQAQLSSAQASLTDVGTRRAELAHAIAVLVGQPPESLTIPFSDWALQIPQIAPGLPATLLERRPDIASAERQMAAANANIGVARAAFYPTLSLNMLYGFQDTGFNLFSLPNDFWTLGPGVALPLFEGGLRNAEEAAAVAQYHQAAANYRQTILEAFQQVEDGLAEMRLLATEAQQEAEAVQAADRTLGMTMNLYKDGAISYLDVVVAQTAALQAQQTAVDIRTRQVAAGVDLVRALGGGWDRRDLPGGKQLNVLTADRKP